MRTWFNKIILLLVAAVLLWSCKKDETLVVVQDGKAPALSASATAAVLTKENASKPAITFTRTAADFGYKAAVNYTLEFAKPNTNFADASSITLDSSSQKAVTTQELNIAALKAGLDAEAAQPVQVRLKADVGGGIAPVYSAPLTLTVTPYSLNSYLWVPGDYQGWAPDKAPRLISINSTGNYEGYVNIKPGSLEFKMTDAPDWNHGIYGDGADGTISSSGGNFKVAAAGYYLLKADLNTNTWKATKTDWGLIGGAVPTTGWDNSHPMTYDEATQTWKTTLDLNKGEIKFRANNSWDINLGKKGADGVLALGGDNIAIAEGGNYTITLDLHTPGAYTYEVKKN